jgi:hypothetical protein
MKISSEQDFRIKENEDRLKKVNKSLEKKIHSREDEVKKVDELYDKKSGMAILEGEEQYAQALDRNAQRVVGVSKDFEDKIQGYKDQLAKTQKMVENEEATLRVSEQTKLEGLKQNMSNNFEERFQDSVQEQNVIEQNTKNTLRNLSLESLNDRRALESNAQIAMNALNSEYSDKSISTEASLRNKLENDLKKQKIDAFHEQTDLKAQSLDDLNKLKRMSNEKSRIQTDQLNFMDRHQQSTIKQKNEDFKVRYSKMVEEHDTIIKQLETQLAEDMKKMVEKSSSDKKAFADRLDDQFYHVQKLNPVVVESPSEVAVSVEIPEHEKENFHLSAQGRNIKMTLSRKFAETLAEQDGSVNRSTRSELFTKDVSTK